MPTFFALRHYQTVLQVPSITAKMKSSFNSMLPFLLCTIAIGTRGHLIRSTEDSTTHMPRALDPQNATADALVYGYPLTQFMSIGGPLAYEVGVNTFHHSRVLSTAADVAVVRPNEDTLYSSLAYDLSHGDVVISYPDMPEDQFHLMTYYDPYGNVLASVGSGFSDEAGQYRIRLRPEGAASGLESNTSAYKGYINSPTMYGVILMRLVLNSTNMDALHGYQNETTSQNVTSPVPAGAPHLLNIMQALQAKANDTGTTTNTTEEIMGLLAAFAPYAPPLHTTQAGNVQTMLSAAGILNGSYDAPVGVDLGAANATAESTIQNCLYPAGKMTTFANNWSMIAVENMSPDFGTHYAIRAVVSRTAYLITKSPNTIYPVWTNTTAGERPGYNGLGGSPLHLADGEALLYDFIGGQPPLQNPGFWSLTMYNVEGYLIQNSVGTYRLGDRDNLTYSDGSLVYPPFQDSTSKPDPRPFQILVQPADVSPPTNWTSNWLPSPSDGSNFTVWLRFYGTEDELVSGGWTFPQVTKIAAIGNGTSGSG